MQPTETDGLSLIARSFISRGVNFLHKGGSFPLGGCHLGRTWLGSATVHTPLARGPCFRLCPTLPHVAGLSWDGYSLPLTDLSILSCPSGQVRLDMQLAHIPMHMQETSQALLPFPLSPSSALSNSAGPSTIPPGMADAPLEAATLIVCNIGESCQHAYDRASKSLSS